MFSDRQICKLYGLWNRISMYENMESESELVTEVDIILHSINPSHYSLSQSGDEFVAIGRTEDTNLSRLSTELYYTSSKHLQSY